MNSSIYLIAATVDSPVVLANCPSNTNFIFDSNVVMLMQRSRQEASPHNEQLSALLKATRVRVNKYWRQRRAHIPIDASYAMCELTNQYQVPNKNFYCEQMMQFYAEVYGVADVDPSWVANWYGDLSGFIQGTLTSTAQAVNAAISLLPRPDEY
jgi:hypothetical protein